MQGPEIFTFGNSTVVSVFFVTQTLFIQALHLQHNHINLPHGTKWERPFVMTIRPLHSKNFLEFNRIEMSRHDRRQRGSYPTQYDEKRRGSYPTVQRSFSEDTRRKVSLPVPESNSNDKTSSNSTQRKQLRRSTNTEEDDCRKVHHNHNQEIQKETDQKRRKNFSPGLGEDNIRSPSKEKRKINSPNVNEEAQLASDCVEVNPVDSSNDTRRRGCLPQYEQITHESSDSRTPLCHGSNPESPSLFDTGKVKEKVRQVMF